MRRNKVLGLLGAFMLAAVGTVALTAYVRTAHDNAALGDADGPGVEIHR